MCGRYTLTVTLDELITRYLLTEPVNRFHAPRYNIAPTNTIPVIVNDGTTNKLEGMSWGLVPFWAKDKKIGYKMINARAETVAEKPAFRNLIKNKRCLIAADGFFEWRQEGAQKQPYRFILKDRDIFSFAGLYDTWTSPDGETLISCTIITTTPNEVTAPVHDRMPVILKRDEEAEWLKPENTDVSTLLSLLQPYNAQQMDKYPVSTAVGNVKNQSKELINNLNTK